ncbi:unnamed protein product [Linum tenue]|uniref:Uncharacterized protein n=1 Tax=Linum tenue TaxID=586396 RepID=A0AAV0QBX6_9ROSI|nr:unnamed protein product [Linum tenue]
MFPGIKPALTADLSPPSQGKKIRKTQVKRVPSSLVFHKPLRFNLGHGSEPARPGLEPRAAPLLVGARPDQRRQRSLHQIPFHAADPHQRVRHRGSARVEAVVRRVRRRVLVLVEAAAEGPRVVRRRAHTRLLGSGLLPHHLRPAPGGADGGNRPVGRDRPVEGESDGGGRRGLAGHADSRR